MSLSRGRREPLSRVRNRHQRRALRLTDPAPALEAPPPAPPDPEPPPPPKARRKPRPKVLILPGRPRYDAKEVAALRRKVDRAVLKAAEYFKGDLAVTAVVLGLTIHNVRARLKAMGR